MENRKYDLEERLIEFGILISDIADMLPTNRLGNYLAGQIIRSGISPALNYGEAQSAESRLDFVHKIKIVLKELRETFISLKIIKRKSLIKDIALLESALKENNELISIFVKSIETAKGKAKRNE
jgi:four helix bundle protein